MERAETLKEGSRLLQGDIAPDKADDIGPIEDLGDRFVWNHSSRIFAESVAPLHYDGIHSQGRNDLNRAGTTEIGLKIVLLTVDPVTLEVGSELGHELFTRSMNRQLNEGS